MLLQKKLASEKHFQDAYELIPLIKQSSRKDHLIEHLHNTFVEEQEDDLATSTFNLIDNFDQKERIRIKHMSRAYEANKNKIIF